MIKIGDSLIDEEKVSYIGPIESSIEWYDTFEVIVDGNRVEVLLDKSYARDAYKRLVNAVREKV